MRDSAGQNLLDTKSNGALLFAKLPGGDFGIGAIFAGKVTVRPVTLSSHQKRLYINLDEDHVAAANKGT
jgi:hypothetical protein